MSKPTPITLMFEAVNLPERRNILGDWPIRGALAMVFIVFGCEKFPSTPGSEWIKIFQQIGVGQWFRYFTGVVEVLGGILLLLPWTVTMAWPSWPARCWEPW